ncbi:peripheral-type benzodiazepine receptor-associated protein 1 isoform X4, partial [Lates japonicus]
MKETAAIRLSNRVNDACPQDTIAEFMTPQHCYYPYLLISSFRVRHFLLRSGCPVKPQSSVQPDDSDQSPDVVSEPRAITAVHRKIAFSDTEWSDCRKQAAQRRQISQTTGRIERSVSQMESAALWEESVDSSSQDPSQTAAAAAVGNPAPGARRMVAIFDYDPRESSPNTDIEAELTFSAGDIIHVFGDMDEDGFFYGDLNGHRGLVPSNFLQALPDDAPAELVSAQPAPEPKKESQ